MRDKPPENIEARTKLVARRRGRDGLLVNLAAAWVGQQRLYHFR